jgi:hypothetical protein
MVVLIAELGAIDPLQAQRLGAAGVATTADLIGQACTIAGRRHLAASTGIRESVLLRWINHIDLMEIDGVGHQYAILLEAAGVSSTTDLAQRDPQRLAESMADVIAARNGARRIPAAAEIALWIDEAQHRPKRVEQERPRPPRRAR